jgi:putative transposase
MERNFANGEFYHILNRGVEKRKIFFSNKDRMYFLHNLYEFNDLHHAPRHKEKNKIIIKNKKRDLLVEIHCFSLMPNHYHMICRQLKEGGISLFIKKVNGGYARGLNEKYKRIGHLFQGRFKSIHIDNERYLMHLVCYIHSNPLELWKPDWKERILKGETEKALEFLKNYRWSSHLDYLGIKNFPSLLNRNFLLSLFGGEKGYLNFFRDWLKYYERNIEKVKGCLIDADV